MNSSSIYQLKFFLSESLVIDSEDKTQMTFMQGYYLFIARAEENVPRHILSHFTSDVESEISDLLQKALIIGVRVFYRPLFSVNQMVSLYIRQGGHFINGEIDDILDSDCKSRLLYFGKKNIKI